MILSTLSIHHVRNLLNLHVSLHPRFTLLTGKNGSGKTAFLEALYLLGRGRSFRSNDLTTIVTQGQKQLTVFARAEDDSTLSIQKSPGLPTQVKINQNLCARSSELAYALPIQVFYQDLFDILNEGSAVRRNALDWGLFHVKPHYLTLWKDYKKVLQQRNALLRQQAPQRDLYPWNKKLVELADAIDVLRQDYFSSWQQQFAMVLQQLTDISCTLVYYKGWDKKGAGKNLETLLIENYTSDLQRQYTQLGAHQADILIKTKTCHAKNIFSRGEQKMVLIALKLSQSDLLQQDCLYLFDDYPAELDETYQQRLLQVLLQRKGQYVITSSVDLSYFHTTPKQEWMAFQLNEGQIQSCS